MGAGDAADYYKKGIIASMSCLAFEDGKTLEITDQDSDQVLATVTASVTDYLNQPIVAYAGNNAAGLSRSSNKSISRSSKTRVRRHTLIIGERASLFSIRDLEPETAEIFLYAGCTPFQR
jgi:hypothetical protein